ncbi:unnamed protein product [Arabidopsis thaliana]|uniref:Uncharacterized protein n=1 Tax=Arabidopsis thaliana TaxID=3702 RepID=A0A654FC38_ARATH|nr:unnamed protein product [Arabidopsis thaliana]
MIETGIQCHRKVEVSQVEVKIGREKSQIGDMLRPEVDKEGEGPINMEDNADEKSTAKVVEDDVDRMNENREKRVEGENMKEDERVDEKVDEIIVFFMIMWI